MTPAAAPRADLFDPMNANGPLGARADRRIAALKITLL
jgi:hypothetical protein